MNIERSLKWTCIALIAGAALLALAGCSHQETSQSTNSANPQPAVSNPTSITLPQVATKDQDSKANPDQLLPGQTVPIKPGSLTPAKDALDQLASEPKSPLPKGTKVLSVSIDDKTGLATANFSSEFQENFPAGDTEEAQVITSVLSTLGQFPNVQNVQFLVNGQKVSTLGGTQDIDEPLPVIRPTDQNAAVSGAGKQNVAMDDSSGQ